MGSDAMQMGQEATATGVCLLPAVAALLSSLHVALSGDTHTELLPFLVDGGYLGPMYGYPERAGGGSVQSFWGFVGTHGAGGGGPQRTHDAYIVKGFTSSQVCMSDL